MVFYIVHMPAYCKTFQNDVLLDVDSASAMLFMQNIFVFTFDMGDTCFKIKYQSTYFGK